MSTPRHILVTGGAGAIGGRLAERFSAAFPDAALTLVDKESDLVNARAHALGPRARARVWDLAQPERLEGVWRALAAEAPPVDVLVNCAGIMEIKSFAGTGWDLGSKLLAVNLTSPMRLMDLALPSMIAARSGIIINVTSMAGRVPIRGCSYYGAAKAGLALASEIARIELREKGVRVVTVYPGPVWSGLERHARAQVKQGIVSRAIPTGDPDEIAERIVRASTRGEARVIYPEIYRVARQLNAVSSWFTEKFSPEPTT